MDWFSKKQATIEKIACGSESSSARTCVEQILDFRTILRHLGVPMRSLSYMLGDNKSVVDSSITSNGNIHKLHAVLSLHRVRESISAGIVNCQLVDRKHNPADV